MVEEQCMDAPHSAARARRGARGSRARNRHWRIMAVANGTPSTRPADSETATSERQECRCRPGSTVECPRFGAEQPRSQGSEKAPSLPSWMEDNPKSWRHFRPETMRKHTGRLTDKQIGINIGTQTHRQKDTQK